MNQLPLSTSPPRVRWIGYAASTWAVVFAAVHVYWALGGRVGEATIGPAITDLASNPWFVLIGLWGVGAACLLLAVLAVALVEPWGSTLPGWGLRTAAWGVGILFTLYGAALLVQHGLMVAGIITIPPGLGATAARWHLVLWDPWWLLGGLLFCAAAWPIRRPWRP